jgi:porphobilinogen synthase
MMDGRVGAIRAALDGEAFERLPIVSYAVKYASAFYGPFRDAAQSAPPSATAAPTRWTRRTPREALREAALDLEEGADIVMVKPAGPYLDVVRRVRDASACRSPPTRSPASTA